MDKGTNSKLRQKEGQKIKHKLKQKAWKKIVQKTAQEMNSEDKVCGQTLSAFKLRCNLQYNKIIANIWTPPERWNVPGAWYWWFWLFFIHDKNTKKTGKCRQVMILWSIKKDSKIKCNELDIEIPVQIERKKQEQEHEHSEKLASRWLLHGAAAAWYFDGKKMHHDFVLEKSDMALDFEGKKLIAPGKTPSKFYMEGNEFVTKIQGKGTTFEFRAKQTDNNPAVGPTYGATKFPGGMQVEGTRLETMELSGFEASAGGKKKKITGTAYFQKILVAVPIPQWFWGLYHFNDGSFFAYMLPYMGKAMLAKDTHISPKLCTPAIALDQNVLFYDALSGKLFEGNRLEINPIKIKGTELWKHEIRGSGKGFEVNAVAEAYSHSCWKFTKNMSFTPFKSVFKYNEYPATVKNLTLVCDNGKKIVLKNGWGNMENSWGFLI